MTKISGLIGAEAARIQAYRHAGVDALRRNPRLVVGFGAIAAILYAYAVITLSDAVDGARAELQSAADTAAQQALNLSDTGWGTRLQDARARLGVYESRLWPGETLSLARASYQQWILQTLREAGITAQPTFDFTPTSIPGIERFQATIVGIPDLRVMEGLLTLAASHPRLIEVTSIEVETVPQPRIALVMSAFIRADRKTQS